MDPSARSALITGASSGIGLAIAAMLGEEGHRLTIAARRAGKLEAARNFLDGLGYEVYAVAGDLGHPAHIRSVVDRHRERYGRLDILINNAGVGVSGHVADVNEKDVQLQIRTNMISVIFFYREAVSMLREAGAEHGRALVVNMSSMSGKEAEAGLGVYGATKHAVVGYTQAMNRELGPRGIRSTAICPGLVNTPMTDYLKAQVAAETMIQPKDISEAVRYLLRTSRGCLIPEIQPQQPEAARLDSHVPA